ncbi:MAG: hypothetical protein JJ959_02840 [Nisaea sp.]|uniref:hypothetical protein n=1 Tax=Nisaea sp. TaxID=2024842 RepID=UPI001B1B572E|nr:hypothetical protein [Nisaea sp.]MBO6559440.1 hypothetical protein [Nisaea sp.]
MDRDNDNSTVTNKPADVIRDTNLKASIWRNESETGPFYATTITRTYKDRDGEYRDTNSFVAGDLLKVAELARKAYERTNELSRDGRDQSAREAFRERRETSTNRTPKREIER